MFMVVCKQCGVELESGMQVCPLCETPVNDDLKTGNTSFGKRVTGQEVKPQLLKHILWQVACVLLLSGVLATLTINLAIEGSVTWSIYPVTICLVVLAYTSLIALWNAKLVVQVLTGWGASCVVLVVVRLYMDQHWPLHLALPIVSALSIASISLIVIFRNMKSKGLNILAIVFVAVAAFCLITEGIISLYFYDEIHFSWSVVVSACLLPVTAAVVFMYLRTRNNSNLQKIFHT